MRVVVYLWLVFALVACCAATKPLTQCKKVCFLDDIGCISKGSGNQYKTIIPGISGLIEPMDPLYIPNIDGDDNSTKYSLTNIVLKGLLGCSVTKLRVNVSEEYYWHYVHCPKLTASFNHEDNGTSCLISGNQTVVTAYKYDIVNLGHYGVLVETRDHMPHFFIKSVQPVVSLKGKLVFGDDDSEDEHKHKDKTKNKDVDDKETKKAKDDEVSKKDKEDGKSNKGKDDEDSKKDKEADKSKKDDKAKKDKEADKPKKDDKVKKEKEDKEADKSKKDEKVKKDKEADKSNKDDEAKKDKGTDKSKKDDKTKKDKPDKEADKSKKDEKEKKDKEADKSKKDDKAKKDKEADKSKKDKKDKGAEKSKKDDKVKKDKEDKKSKKDDEIDDCQKNTAEFLLSLIVKKSMIMLLDAIDVYNRRYLMGEALPG